TSVASELPPLRKFEMYVVRPSGGSTAWPERVTGMPFFISGRITPPNPVLENGASTIPSGFVAAAAWNAESSAGTLVEGRPSHLTSTPSDLRAARAPHLIVTK